jgi:flagellar P-ring protein precursor FlgI
MKRRSNLIRKSIITAIVSAFCVSLGGVRAHGESVRIKDLTNIKGVRSNQLLGFGLIVGLSGSGDSKKSLATNKAYASMLQNLGMSLGKDAVANQNVAAVLVTAELPAFARNGDRISIKLSAVGDSKSLAGGTLVMTPLRAGDGEVYATAQGSVVTGQATGQGAKVLTTASIPDGAVVEREFTPSLGKDGKIRLSLREADFSTNSRIADTINAFFRGFYAASLDPATIEVSLPEMYVEKVVEFISEMEMLRVDVERRARVVINQRTGTVVLGGDVVIAPVSIAHGELSLKVGEKKKDDKAGGQKVVGVNGTTVSSLLESLNAMGVSADDLVGILQAVHSAGALQAELEFM